MYYREHWNWEFGDVVSSPGLVSNKPGNFRPAVQTHSHWWSPIFLPAWKSYDSIDFLNEFTNIDWSVPWTRHVYCSKEDDYLIWKEQTYTMLSPSQIEDSSHILASEEVMMGYKGIKEV